jgi:hypothetical protein
MEKVRAIVAWGEEPDWDASLYRWVLMCTNCGYIMDFQDADERSEPVWIPKSGYPSDPDYEESPCCPRCLIDLSEVEPRYVTIWPEIPGVPEALTRGECQTIEFKSWKDKIQGKLPTPLKKLLTESIAAFATSNPGIIYLGIEDDGTVTGVDTNISEDQFGRMIADFAKNRVKPSLDRVEVRFLTHTVEGEKKAVIAIAVPKGSAPVYYTEANTPYLRDGKRNRPAEPHEVERLHRAHKKAPK